MAANSQKPSTPPQSTLNTSAIASADKRRSRARLWLISFTLLMPLGCIGPLGLLQVLPEGPVKLVALLAGFVLPFVGLGGTILMLSDRSRYSKYGALAKSADTMGLVFVEKPREEHYGNLREFQTIVQNHADDFRLFHVLTGQITGTPVSIMETTFIFGYGQSATVAQQTMVYLPGVAAGLPSFWIIPKGSFAWLEKSAAKLVGKAYVELPDQPAFNKNFYLYGENPQQILRCLSPDVVRLCLAAGNLTMEVYEGSLLLFEYKKSVPHKQYPEQVERAVKMLKALLAADRHS